MQGIKGIVTGFVAGLAVAGGAILLLRDEAPLRDESARIDELGAQIERLERSVSLLSANVVSIGSSPMARGDAVASAAPAATASKAPVPPTAEQQRVIESADAFVDQAIQAGLWTQDQQADLSALTAGLPVEEQGRIQARISAAINNDLIKPELR